MAKLVFDFLKGVTLQKNFGQKFWHKSCTRILYYKMPKKLASKNVRCLKKRLFKSLPVNFRLRRTSVETSKKMVIYLFLGCKIRLWISGSVLKWLCLLCLQKKIVTEKIRILFSEIKISRSRKDFNLSQLTEIPFNNQFLTLGSRTRIGI